MPKNPRQVGFDSAVTLNQGNGWAGGPMDITFGIVYGKQVWGGRNEEPCPHLYLYTPTTTTCIMYQELGYSMHHPCFSVDIWNRGVFNDAAMTAFERLLDLKLLELKLLGGELHGNIKV